MILAMNSWIPGYCICVPFSNYFYFLQLIILLLLFFGDFVKVSGVRCWPCKSAGCFIPPPPPGNCPRGKLLPDNCSLMIGPLITAVWAIFPLGKSSYKKSHPNDNNNNNNNINNNDNNKSLRPGNTGLMSSGG